MAARKIGELWHVVHNIFGLVAVLHHEPTALELYALAKSLS